MVYAVIDFQQLMKDERRRARQQRRQQEPERTQQSSSNNGASAETESTTTTTAGTKPYPLNIVAAGPPPVLPPWTVSSSSSPVLSFDSPFVFDCTNCCLCDNDPDSIYYIPDFLSNDFQMSLQAWLLQLEEQQQQQPPNSSLHDNDERSTLHRWTYLKHAKRKVAVFQQQKQKKNQQETNNNNNDDPLSQFPLPLAVLVNELIRANVFPIVKQQQQRKTTTKNSTTVETKIGGENASTTEPSAAAAQDDDSTSVPNHILVNHYPDGTRGILPHTDGPAYEPCTAIVSLGGDDDAYSTLMDFSPRPRYDDDTTDSLQQRQRRQVWLRPGSLLVFTGSAYQDYLHGIAELQPEDNDNNDGDDGKTIWQTVSDACLNAPAGIRIQRGPRVSLTIRHKYQLIPTPQTTSKR